MKKILIIAFKFPPMGGIGTRRWAKFTKYLTRNGYILHVLTIKYKYRDKVNWIKDIENNKNIVIHKINPGCPDFMLKVEKGICDKILNRFLRPFISKKYPLDIAQRWSKYLVPAANDIIKKEHIKNLIVTGPPSSVQFAGALIKVENPELNYILDYRDPWNSDRDYSLSSIGFENKRQSVIMEKFSIDAANKVVVVTKDMKRNLINTYSINEDKVHVIYNGYDLDDFDLTNLKYIPDFNMVYTGGLGKDRKGRMNSVLYIAKALKELNDDILNGLKITMYTDLTIDSFHFSEDFDVISKSFTFNSFVSPSEIPEIIKKHRYCLSINDPRDAHAFGTKIFDYMALGKKIMHISNGGELSTVLKDKKQIVADYNLVSVKKALKYIKNDFQSGSENNADFSSFNLESLTENLMSLISE